MLNNHDRLSRRGFLLASAAAGGAVALPGSASAAKEVLPDVDNPGRTPNTKFAVNLEMWFKGPLEERINQAAELGFPAVEFWPYQKRDIGRMAGLLEKHGMTCTQFTAWGFGTELNDPKAKAANFVKAIEESCAVAAKLPGCGMFTVVIGNNIEGLTKDEMHGAAVEKIKEAVPILEQHKKTIIIEPMNPFNHPGHCLYGSGDGIAICKAIGSEQVKLNWDLFHMQRFEGNIIDYMRKGKDYIGYLQLADSPDRNEPGTGEVNYTEVFKAIKELEYTLPVGLECHPKDGDVVRAAKRVHLADTW
jgi:hydroxypyruvate isomerase